MERISPAVKIIVKEEEEKEEDGEKMIDVPVHVKVIQEEEKENEFGAPMTMIMEEEEVEEQEEEEKEEVEKIKGDWRDYKCTDEHVQYTYLLYLSAAQLSVPTYRTVRSESLPITPSTQYPANSEE